MTFDTSNTGDDWDNYVPEPPPMPEPTAMPMGNVRSPVASAHMAGPGAPLPRMSSGPGFSPKLLAIPVLLVVMVIGAIANRGTTQADDLQAGDCFEMPKADSEFSRLTTNDCDLPHDGQILAQVVVVSNESYPEDLDTYWQTVYSKCLEWDTRLVRMESLPADTELYFFQPTPAGWAAGDRESLCYIHAPGGLEGSFVGVLATQ